jgi:hypothetical protein
MQSVRIAGAGLNVSGPLKRWLYCQRCLRPHCVGVSTPITCYHAQKFIGRWVKVPATGLLASRPTVQ